jgi:hypothetical protein
MYTAFECCLVGYGWLTRGSSIYLRHSLGINVNWWGLALWALG